MLVNLLPVNIKICCRITSFDTVSFFSLSILFIIVWFSISFTVLQNHRFEITMFSPHQWFGGVLSFVLAASGIALIGINIWKARSNIAICNKMMRQYDSTTMAKWIAIILLSLRQILISTTWCISLFDLFPSQSYLFRMINNWSNPIITFTITLAVTIKYVVKYKIVECNIIKDCYLLPFDCFVSCFDFVFQ